MGQKGEHRNEPHIYGPLIFKGCQDHSMGKTSLFKERNWEIGWPPTKRIKSDPLLTPYTKINKMDLKCKTKTLRGNTESILVTLGYKKISLDMTLKAQAIIEKKTELDFSLFKIFLPERIPSTQ